LAAEHADIVAFAGIYQVKGAAPGKFRMATAAEFDERVAFYRSIAGDRGGDQERGLLLQWVELGDDQREVAERLRAEHDMSTTVEELLDSPVMLLGTLDQAVERLHQLRDRYGVSYLVAHRRSFDSWSQVVRAMRSG
jgi:alkanesulfonate monooxygenase SsuD/methylene tetrahydromethanopterin reductase-like flavin-dependent oxidoreductase (luciferase family)